MPTKQRPRKTNVTTRTNNGNNGNNSKRYDIGVRKRPTSIRNMQKNPTKPKPRRVTPRVNNDNAHRIRFNLPWFEDRFGKAFRHPNTWRSEMHRYRVNNVPHVSTLKNSIIEWVDKYGGLRPWKKYNKSVIEKRRENINDSIQNYRKGKLKELKTKITSRGTNPSTRHINTAMRLPPVGYPYKFPRKSRYYNNY